MNIQINKSFTGNSWFVSMDVHEAEVFYEAPITKPKSQVRKEAQAVARAIKEAVR